MYDTNSESRLQVGLGLARGHGLGLARNKMMLFLICYYKLNAHSTWGKMAAAATTSSMQHLFQLLPLLKEREEKKR